MVGVRRRGEEWCTRYIGDLGLRQRLFEHEARGVKAVGKGQSGEEAAFGASVVDRGGKGRVKRMEPPQTDSSSRGDEPARSACGAAVGAEMSAELASSRKHSGNSDLYSIPLMTMETEPASSR